MELTILGCWAPYPREGGACSGYLLQSEGKNIVIEMGNGVLSNLQKHVDFRKIDAVVISHLHPDHYFDIYCLRHAIGGARRLDPLVKPVPLYVPDSPAESFNKLKEFSEAFSVNPIEELPIVRKKGIEVRETRIAGLTVNFMQAEHPLTTYSMLIEGARKIFYTADTKWSDKLPLLSKGVDLILSEASVTEEDSEYTSVGHLTCRQAGELGRQAGVKQLAVTHFWPEYDLNTIKAETEAGFGSPVVLAHEGLKMTV